jgi:hypothetical protein
MTSGELDFNNFSQRSSAPGAPMPVVSNTDQNQIRVISSLEEMRAAVEAIAASAQRLMSIYTLTSNPSQNGFLDIMKRFVLARRFAKLSRHHAPPLAVTTDSSQWAPFHELHRYPTIVAGARQRARLPDRHRVPRSFRSLGRRRRANNPPVVRQYLDEFDEIWQTSSPDEIARRRCADC